MEVARKNQLLPVAMVCLALGGGGIVMALVGWGVHLLDTINSVKGCSLLPYPSLETKLIPAEVL